MTGRRRRDRRRGQFIKVITEQRNGEDRREFLRRFSDLGAEIEAVQMRGDREILMARLANVLRSRGVVA